MIKSGDHTYYWQASNGLALLAICQFSQAARDYF